MNKQTEAKPTMEAALKMAIEALQSIGDAPKWKLINEAIQACKEALEQPAQEPVAWMDDYKNIELKLKQWMIQERDFTWQPLYTHPHQWQGLTDDEIRIIDFDVSTSKENLSADEYILMFAREIEKHHEIK